MPDAPDRQQQPIAVSLFVAATFVGALPMILFPDQPWWTRAITTASAFVLLLAGFARLRRERAEAAGQGDEPSAPRS